MTEGGIGRLLVASLHQAIADLLPTRLEFYEAWLHPTGLRNGRIGLAPLAAVLSFLRLEGEAYRLVTARAGEYAAEWTVGDLAGVRRSFIRAMPKRVRARLVMRLARALVRRTYGGSRAVVRWRKGKGMVDIRGSLFCEVRDRVKQPLCEFYASAIRRLMELFEVPVQVDTEQCRATGAGRCLMAVLVHLCVLIGCATVAAAQAGPPAPPSTSLQLVIPFENATGEPRVYWLGEASAVLLTDDLLALGAPAIRREDRLRAFDRLRVPPVATLSHATVIRLGQVVGAAQVVLGAFELQSGELVVRARTIRLDTGRISRELVERGALSEILSIYGRIARRIVPDSPVSAEQMEQGYPPLSAFEQYIKGLLAEAPEAQIAFLTQALRLSPAFQHARLALWEVQTEQGKHQEALDVVRAVPAGDRLARQARFLSAVSMLHLGQAQAAFAEFSVLNRLAPDPALLNNMGVAQLRRGAAAPGGRPVSFFGEAVTLDGSDSDLFFNLGYAYWLDRDAQGAVYWLREAVRRNPADGAAHYALGVALQATANAAEAAREKELARRLSSTYAEWEAKQPGVNAVPRGLERLKLGIDVTASLRVDAAVVAAEQRDQRAIATFHLERARRLFEAERDEEAIGELRRTIFLAPYESEAHLLLGRIYLRTGRRQDAVDALTIALWSDSGNAAAKELLDRIRTQLC